ncbi:DUF1822 family protein [Planktothrix pseudagardhii]|uniref:DUF1822 family protein n=1 Tax=Planktothrix pseudagardhii TaxID=132604 RepID=A0A9W4CQB5_9CYAN|nr:DUF1822 family protein [Planktothrix pseudagardhii]CAD5972433.1 hypothetical protein NO713_03915 [Planktothrix pseudagardhii]
MKLHLTEMTKDLTITIPLRKRDFDLAKKLSQQHEHSQKQQQIYLNTLSRCAIHSYCQYLDIETNFDELFLENNRTDYFTDYFMDVSDLTLKGWGKVECRAILPDSEFCYIPPEAFSDRIGYFIIEIDAENWQANILDFLAQVTQSEIDLSQLHRNPQTFLEVLSLLDILKQLNQQLEENQPSVNVQNLVNSSLGKIQESVEDLTLWLNNILGEQLPDVLANAINFLDQKTNLIQLQQWFSGVFSNGWQPEKRALTLSIQPDRNLQPANIEQPEVNGAKVIRLGMQIPQETVILILRQKQLSEAEIEVNLRLYPSAEAMYLPDGVKLSVLDETGNPIPELEAQARADNWLQLKFTGEPGDQFSVKVSLEESSITENFLL